TWGNTRAEPRTARIGGKARILAAGILAVVAMGAAGIWLLRGARAGQDTSSSGAGTPATVPQATALSPPSSTVSGAAPPELVKPSAAASAPEPMAVAPTGAHTKKSQGSPGTAVQARKKEADDPRTSTAAQNSLVAQPAATAAVPSGSSKPKRGY